MCCWCEETARSPSLLSYVSDAQLLLMSNQYDPPAALIMWHGFDKRIALNEYGPHVYRLT